MLRRILRRITGQSAHRKYRVNLRLFGIVLVGAVVLMGSVYLVHGFQVKHHADKLKAKAERSYEEGEFGRAINYMRHYVTFEPKDAKALGRLGEWLEKHGRSRNQLVEALLTLDQALREEPSRADLLRRAVRIEEKLGRPKQALARLDVLRERDAELTSIEARCLMSLGENDRAARAYITAIRRAPREGQNYEELIRVVESRAEKLGLARLIAAFSAPAADQDDGDGHPAPDDPDEAAIDSPSAASRTALIEQDRRKLVGLILDAMLRDAEPKYRAHLLRAGFFERQGKHEQASESIELSLAEAPQDPDVLVMAAEIENSRAAYARLQDDPEQVERHRQAALELARRGLALERPDLRFYLVLSRLEADGEQAAEAERHLRDGLVAADKLLAGDRDGGRLEARYRDQIVWSLANVLVTRAFLAGESPAGAGAAGRKKILEEVQALIKVLKDAPRHGGRVDYIEARIRLAQREWDGAARLFERARPALADAPEAVHNVDLALAQCYTRLSNPEARLRVFARAVDEAPEWEQGQLGLAESLAALGQLDEALVYYNRRQIAGLPGVKQAVTQILIRKQLALPSGQRTWDRVSRALESVGAGDPDAPEALLPRADVLVQQQKFAEAEALLVKARDSRPDEIAYWIGLVKLALRRSDLSEPVQIARADELLAQARKQLGDRIELRLVEVETALYWGGAKAGQRLATIEARMGDLKDDDLRRMTRRVAQGYLAIGAPELGLARWQPAARDTPENLDDQLLLAELALRAGNQQALADARQRIRKIEGADGPNGNYVEAVGLMIKNGPNNKPADHDLDTAKIKLEEAAKSRAKWPAIPRQLGVIAAMRGNPEAALQHFRKALELGDRSRDTLLRIVDYLRKQGRFEEARDELNRAVATAPDLLSGDLARLASRVAAALGNPEEALALADRVGPGTRGYSDLLWQVELAFAKGTRGAEVEDLARQATELAPDAPRAWLVRVELLVQEGKIDEARAVTAQSTEKLPLTPLYVKPLTLGACYELLGDRAAAEGHFLRAVEADRLQFMPRLELANFYIRGGELEKAQKQVEALLEPGSSAPKWVSEAARRTRALIAAQKGTYDDLVAAIRMLPGVQSEGDLKRASEEDLRTLATVLARSRLKRERVQLVRVLGELRQRNRLNPPERLQLARLLQAQGTWPQARQIYRELLDLDPANPTVLAEYALSSLRNAGKLDDDAREELKETIERLEKAEPDSFRTVLARARLLAAENGGEDAVPVLERYLKRLEVAGLSDRLRKLVAAEKLDDATAILVQAVREHDEPGARRVLIDVQRLKRKGDAEALAVLRKYIEENDLSEVIFTKNLRLVAGALESLGQPQAAEALLRKAAEGSSSAARLLPLVQFVARRNGIDEALDLCDQAESTAPPAVMATTAIGVLRTGKPKPEQMERVEKRLVSAIAAAQPAEKPRFQLLLAELREIQGRYPEMTAIYRKLIEEDGRNVTALNNLAWFLSFDRADRDSSLDMINRAIQLAGPHPELLDTRAVVQLNLGNAADAVADLGSALQEGGTASMWFHMAVAQNRKGDKAEAAAALKQAEEAGFDPQSLHPLEKGTYDKLIEAIPRRG